MSRHVEKPASDSQEFIYDLYAVCNHYGNLQGGHYTGISACNIKHFFNSTSIFLLYFIYSFLSKELHILTLPQCNTNECVRFTFGDLPGNGHDENLLVW